MNERDTSRAGDEMPREQQLGELYRELPFSEPPLHLDASLLKAAREDTTADPRRAPIQPFARHWAWPVSLVALMVLSVSVVVLVQPQVDLDDAVLLAPTQKDVPAQETETIKPTSPGTADSRPRSALALEPPRPAAEGGPAPEQAPSTAFRAVPQPLPSSAADGASKRQQETTGLTNTPTAKLHQKNQIRRAHQSAERDAVRERLRASARESRKRETGSERRDELKRLLDAAEPPKPVAPALRSVQAPPAGRGVQSAPADDANARTRNKTAAPRAPGPGGATVSAAAQNRTIDPITREFSRIRALLDQGYEPLATEVLAQLLRRYPGIPVPQDILSRVQ